MGRGRSDGRRVLSPGRGSQRLWELPDPIATLTEVLHGSDTDMTLVQDAVAFMQQQHASQWRAHTDPSLRLPYAVHPARSVLRLFVGGYRDPELLAAMANHDVLEDCPWVTKEDLRARFGARVTRLVDGVTKHPGLSRRENFLRAFEEGETAIMKAADRWDNVEDLRNVESERRRSYVNETRKVLLPAIAGSQLRYPEHAAFLRWAGDELDRLCAELLPA